MSKVFNIYIKLFEFIYQERLQKRDVPRWKLHGLLAVTITTVPLMWTYGWVAAEYISDPLAGQVGYLMSLIHILSPLILFKSNRIFLAMNLMLGSGIIHQATFSFFSGGFESSILVWLGILPLMAGVINGRPGAVTWFLTTLTVVSAFIYRQYILGIPCPNNLSKDGFLVAQGMLLYGQIYLSSGLIFIYISIREHIEEQLSGSKSKVVNLVRILGHDISNPLFVVENRLKRFLKSNDKKDVEIAYKNSKIIGEIIKDVRDIEAIESGKKEVELEKVCLDKLLEEVKSNFPNIRGEKNIELEIVKNNFKNYEIIGNYSFLRNQVFNNILTNSVKFSYPESKIKIEISENDSDFLIVTVQDQGIGIPQNLLPKLFDITTKTTRPGTSGEIGTGFGLPIVKTVLDTMGAEITINSKALYPKSGHGSTFKLKFERH